MNELKRAMKDLGTCVGMIDEHYQYTPYSSEKVEPFKSYPVRETNLKGLQMHLREMGERGLK